MGIYTRTETDSRKKLEDTMIVFLGISLERCKGKINIENDDNLNDRI